MTRTPTSDVASVRYLVADVDAAVAFYTDVLGFALRTDARPALAELVRGPLRLLLSGPVSTAGRSLPDGRAPQPGGWNRIHLVVEDLAAEVTRLRAAGVVVRTDPISGPGGQQVLLEDPSGNPVELFQPAGRPHAEAGRSPDVRSRVLLRSEETGGSMSLVENVVAAGSAGPPLHRHDFDEAFHVLEGELVLRVGDTQLTRTAGQSAVAPRGVPHALANPSPEPARYLLVCTPAGFERHFARLAAQADGVEPPQWALQPVPEVVWLGPAVASPGR